MLLSRSFSRLLCVLCSFLLGSATYAQEYSYARYDVKDGLAGSVAYCATEDRDGFLWFGTETGLSRFDGTHFTNFTTADGLPDNEVLRLFTDSRNRVWICTFSNDICYYYKGRIHNRQNDSLLKSLPIGSNVLDVAEDGDGCIGILEAVAFHVISPEQKITTIDHIKKAEIKGVKLGLGRNGSFRLFLDCYGIAKFIMDVQHDTMYHVDTLDGHTPAGRNFNYFSPALDIGKHADNLLHFVRYPSKKEVVIPIPDGFTNLSVINDSICTLNTSNGSLFFNINNQTIIRHCLQGKIINATFRDSEDNYWFFSQGSGIFRVGSFDFNNITFTENKLDYYSIFSLGKIGRDVYAGSERSLVYKINRDSDRVRVQPIRLLPDVEYSRIMSILKLSDSSHAISSDIGVEVLGNKQALKDTGIRLAVKHMSLYQGKIILTTHQSVYLTRSLSDISFNHMRVVYTQRGTCAYGRNDTFYVGTQGGMFRTIGTNTNKPAEDLGTKFPPLHNRINDIREGRDGLIWIATSGNGLVGFRNDSIVYHIRQQDGLTSNICRAMFIDGNDVWIGTDKGLNRLYINGQHVSITVFSATDGLISNVVNAVYIGGNEVFVGTPAGLTYFDAGKIAQKAGCKLRLTAIHTAHNEWLYDTARFVLPHAENDLRVDYVGISYRSAGDIVYRYRLIGLSDNWQTTRETFLSYPSLPSGDYELQLVAINKFGIESTMLQIPFRVQKLLWEETWFKIFVLVFVWIAIWIFVNARIKRVRRLNERQIQVSNHIAELEQQALKAQMNPHFIFNSLNSLQQYVIEKDVIGANKFITDFSRLIRLTLDISSKTRINIYEEISYITTYLELEKTKFENKFSYEIVVSPDLHPADWYIPPMILQPYVENSIRHGVRNRSDNKGMIRVSVTKDMSHLVCVIEDNGVGRAIAAQYKSKVPIEYQSKGMTLTAKRIEMLNRHHDAPVLITIDDLYIDDKPAGTRVSLRFPLQDAGRTI